MYGTIRERIEMANIDQHKRHYRSTVYEQQGCKVRVLTWGDAVHVDGKEAVTGQIMWIA